MNNSQQKTGEVLGKTSTAHDGSRVVLHYRGECFGSPWATWIEGGPGAGKYWGHYFDNQADAVTDYNERK